MNINNDERRTCIRFQIPNAVANYKLIKPFSFLKKNKEKSCPIEEISRGGIGFLCRNKLKMNTRIKFQIEIPEEEFPQAFLGQIKWIVGSPKPGFAHRVGVQFNPYGTKNEENHPKLLKKIIELGKKYSKSV